MRKSLTRVKKFLGSADNLQSTHSHVSQALSPRSGAPSLPQVICQNQDLKEQVKRLLDQRESFQKSMQGLSSQRRQSKSRNSLSYQQQPKISRSLHKQFINKNSNYLNCQQQQSSIKVNRFTITYERQKQLLDQIQQLKLNICIEKEKNRKSNQKINYLTRLIENDERNKKQMLFMIDTLSKKLEDSTEYIKKLQRLPPFEQHHSDIKNIQNQQQNIRFYNGENNKIQIIASELSVIQNLQISQLVQLKDENFQLRNRLADLILNNTQIRGKLLRPSVTTNHLWKIKQVQFANLRNCIDQLKLK